MTRTQYRMCERKQRYRSESEATKVGRRRGVRLRVYCCPLCDGYHLTKDVG